MRLFTGLSLPPAVVDNPSAVIRELRPKVPLRWSPEENLHITSRFIGQWPDDRLDELKTALGDVAARGPIHIAVSKFGFLPNPNRPHVFFAGVQADPDLTALSETIGDALAQLGLPKETRPYQPHVTLARIKPGNDIRALRDNIARMTACDFGTFVAAEFHLYLSASAGGRTVYTRLATYYLKGENSRIQ